jgi:hypothetical protein
VRLASLLPVSLLPYKVQQFRCYRSGLRRLLLVGEYGGIEADRQTNSCTDASR